VVRPAVTTDLTLAQTIDLTLVQLSIVVQTAFIVPHWNNYPLLSRCLVAVCAQTEKDFSVLVVDNGSTDGSPLLVARDFPSVRLIRLKENLGFAAAVNRGIAASRSEYLAFVNNDVRLAPDWLEKMLGGIRSDLSLGAVAGKLLFDSAPPDRIASAGSIILKSGFGRDRGCGEEDRGQFDRREEIFWASGGACLIPRRLFADIGLWDETFFAYFEDIDLGLRARLRGYRCLYLPAAVGRHVGGATGDGVPRLGAALRFRNAFMVALKNFPGPVLRRHLVYVLFSHLRALVYLAAKGYGREAWRGEIYLARNLRRIMAERRRIQKARTVPVSAIAGILSSEDFSAAALRGWFSGLARK
jgi:hypothetical protein